MKYLYYFESVPGSSLFFTFYLVFGNLVPYNSGKPFKTLQDLNLSARKDEFNGLVKLSHQQLSVVPGVMPPLAEINKF